MLPALPVRSYAVYTEAKSILQGVAPAYLAAPLPAYLAGAVGCLSQLCSCLGAKSKPTKAPPSQPADEVWHAHPLNNNPGTTGCTLRAYGGSDPPVCVWMRVRRAADPKPNAEAIRERVYPEFSGI